MVASAPRRDWQHSQDALRDEVERVTALLRSIRDPGAAPVVGHWNLAEVAYTCRSSGQVYPAWREEILRLSMSSYPTGRAWRVTRWSRTSPTSAS